MLLAGLVVFTLASLAAGLAGSAGALVAARLVQGCGAALILPAMLAVVSVGNDDRRRSVGVAVWMASGAGALALGPVVGGYLTQHAHWSWVFLLNVPLGAAVIALAAVAVPESRDDTAARVDVPGVAASVVVLSAGTFGLTFGAELGWTSPVILAALAVSAVTAVVFVAVERLGRDPMVDLELFRARAFTGGVVAQVLWGLGVNGVFFFTALFLQGSSVSARRPRAWPSCRWPCSSSWSRRWSRRWRAVSARAARSPWDWSWWRRAWSRWRSCGRGTAGRSCFPPCA
nr:hypothetical protein GCM10020093_065280 [Planobispora longispora]